MHTFHAMNTTFHTLGLSSNSMNKAESWFSFIEKNLSRFLPTSELSNLNRNAGRPFLASALLYQATSVAEQYFRETGGIFNPYLGQALIAQGYSESLESLEGAPMKVSVPDGSTALVAIMPEEPAALDRRMMSIRLHQGVSLDLGGIAKGWSAEQLAGMLKREGVSTGALDAGGDLILWGMPRSGWEIGIADPFVHERNKATLKLKRPAGIATSTTMKRRWGTKEDMRHHLIDPRTLRPADTDLVQVTVLASSLTEAEAYAKSVLIQGSEDGIPWLEDRKPELGYFAVTEDGRSMAGGSLFEYADLVGESHAAAI